MLLKSEEVKWKYTMEGTIYRAIIPVKSLSEAKSRLAPHFTQYQRETLALDMLRHVVQTLCASQEFELVSVVSPDMRVLEKARIWGARALFEERSGHNPALHMAALLELAEGADALLTISADLPLLTPDDIGVMVERSTRFDVVLAPSLDGTGTNAMLARPPLAVPYLFGVNSLKKHLRAARRRGLSASLYASRGLSLDIDTIEDVEELERVARAGISQEIQELERNSRAGASPACTLYGSVGIAS